MRLRLLALALGTLVAGAGLLAPAAARAGAQCEERPAAATGGAVSLVVLATPAKVRELANSLRKVPVLRRSPDTVVFADGRVITSDVESAGRHLNAIGWANRRIEVMASFGSRGGRRRPG